MLAVISLFVGCACGVPCIKGLDTITLGLLCGVPSGLGGTTLGLDGVNVTLVIGTELWPSATGLTDSTLTNLSLLTVVRPSTLTNLSLLTALRLDSFCEGKEVVTIVTVGVIIDIVWVVGPSLDFCK